jgi:hypothetical protein
MLDGERRTIIIKTMDHPLRRLTALLAAVLFLLSGAGDAFGAHACPHHAAIGAPAQGGGAVDHAAMAHHGHGVDHSAPAAPADHDSHAACTCGGVCPVSAGVAPLAGPATFHLAILVSTAAPAARTENAELPSRLVPHFLPFAQAPPSLG